MGEIYFKRIVKSGLGSDSQDWSNRIKIEFIYCLLENGRGQKGDNQRLWWDC